MNPQNPKTKIKMESQKKYKEIQKGAPWECAPCDPQVHNSFRSSGVRIWPFLLGVWPFLELCMDFGGGQLWNST